MQKNEKDTNPNQWMFDTGTNAHIFFYKEYVGHFKRLKPVVSLKKNIKALEQRYFPS